MEPIRILLVDDHTLFRSGLKYLLEMQDDFLIVAEASNGRDGLALTEQLKPDVVLLDLDMPVESGRDILPLLLEAKPDLAVLILTISEDGADLTECMRLGARGYLLKNINTDFLLNSIRRALDGDSVLSPEMTSKLIQHLRGSSQTDGQDIAYINLTLREKEILSGLATGQSNKEIALQFELKESTVKVHVQNILRKLNLKSRVQAAVYAVEHGFDKIQS